MKLYLLSQKINAGYDTYDSCVVCAENIADAKTIRPNGDEFKENDKYCYGWVKYASDITVEELGEANGIQRRGVIIASFNAG